MKQSILCVDDEIDNVEALERLFRRKYKVLKATSGDEGLALLQDEDVALIISDQRMPKMSGVEFLKKSTKIRPHAIRILLTGYTDIDSIIGAINSGEVYRYLNKPWDPVDLQNTVDKAVEKYNLRSELSEKNSQLEAALKELKTLDEAKNHFMVLINHELKTPLTVLLSFLELMKESSLNEEQQMFADRMQKSADRLKKLIDDVLQLVSAESGQLKLSKKKTSTIHMLDFIEKDFSASAEAKGQKIVAQIDDAAIKVDQKIMTTVVSKLVENALKFGEDKSNIEVVAEERDDGIFIGVANKGKSLPKATINKILKPFALDENIMNHSEGLGLGLSLCQALLRHHGSQLEFSSKKGTTTVGFQLPSA